MILSSRSTHWYRSHGPTRALTRLPTYVRVGWPAACDTPTSDTPRLSEWAPPHTSCAHNLKLARAPPTACPQPLTRTPRAYTRYLTCDRKAPPCSGTLGRRKFGCSPLTHASSRIGARRSLQRHVVSSHRVARSRATRPAVAAPSPSWQQASTSLAPVAPHRCVANRPHLSAAAPPWLKWPCAVALASSIEHGACTVGLVAVRPVGCPVVASAL